MLSKVISFLKNIDINIKVDVYLILAILLLLGFGMVVIWSTNPVLAQKQFYFVLFGLVLFFTLSVFDYRNLARISPYLFFLVVIFLVLTPIVGARVRGTGRWLSLGPLTFQPSELAKLALILVLSWFYCVSSLDSLHKFLVSLLIAIFTAGLVAIQPDLGTAVVLIALWVFVSFVAKIPLIYFIYSVLVTVLMLPIAWSILAPYQQERIYAFISPRSDPLGSGYNVLQAVIAVGSGMFFGRGLGRGPQSQLRFLPERTTDFAFASLAEEWGLLGACVLLGLFFLLLARLWKIASSSETGFGALVTTGVFAVIFTQIIINVGMNVGIMPVTGLPLPLISAGGSSLITTLASLGLAHSVFIHTEN
ncbi:MAG: rod shape-determining protein RodA [Patescibacteria group bacterium]|nr:rod shape-determining protein RodA [Patescibacteria group bacterium]